MIYGIDVSNHQHQINWNDVPASGVQFAIAKASEGVTFVDRWFGRNWSEMKRVGLVRGAYHYALPSSNQPEQEADFFLSRVQNPEVATLEPGDLVALDMEDPEFHSSLALWSLRWLRRVEERLGFKPLFYTYPHYMDTHDLHDARLAEYGLWFASYRDDMPDPPAPWPMIAIWQHTSEATIPGAGTRIDANWFNGDNLDQLRAYGKPGTRRCWRCTTMPARRSSASGASSPRPARPSLGTSSTTGRLTTRRSSCRSRTRKERRPCHSSYRLSRHSRMPGLISTPTRSTPTLCGSPRPTPTSRP
jgi:lysozyme